MTIEQRHEKISEQIGVCFLMWNKAKNDGKWPSLAPVAKSRAEVKMTPLTPPKVLSATKIGISQLSFPKTLLPNVCWGEKNASSSTNASTRKNLQLQQRGLLSSRRRVWPQSSLDLSARRWRSRLACQCRSRAVNFCWKSELGFSSRQAWQLRNSLVWIL